MHIARSFFALSPYRSFPCSFSCSFSCLLSCLLSCFLPALLVVLTSTKGSAETSARERESNYKSPYSIRYSVPMEELTYIDRESPRNDPRLESEIPFELWYSGRVRKEFGAWGPLPRHYPAIPNYQQKSLNWKRERVLAVACSHIGLAYQHHHIPSWDPPADWPWKQVAWGRNSKGVDCSDFSSWCYNYGLGIKLKTGIKQQALTTQLKGPGLEGTTEAKVIIDDSGYDKLCAKLKTGDLLYIRNLKGNLAHVIMWVGDCGQSPDGSPLIIDCTGEGHKDANGADIPIGVQLRPFLKTGWYYKSFDHAHRILHGN